MYYHCLKGQKLGNEAGSLWWFWTAVAEQPHNPKKNMTLHMSWWWFSLSTIKEDGFYTLWTNLQPSLIHAQVNGIHPSNVLKSSLSILIFRMTEYSWWPRSIPQGSLTRREVITPCCSTLHGISITCRNPNSPNCTFLCKHPHSISCIQHYKKGWRQACQHITIPFCNLLFFLGNRRPKSQRQDYFNVARFSCIHECLARY